ncbi:ABC transporter permease [Spongiactinospora sp. TRM90649]|uniref:ABC transporter permease n=1 Tax=Spongiactinospora sp. TRM90649 TaxID=3031114 RepID=UPI0023F9C631|nr:ABC transporter permease [Spongiactinospora sp. TRM90649]MDF5752885.1 ABC transporter permease [Spongiactinospora sp. TRM90649]
MADLAFKPALDPVTTPARAHWPVMASRCLRLSLRGVDALIIALLLPVIMMLMFVFLFGGAIETGTDYVTYVLPGVLVLCAGYGASLTAVSLNQDLKDGIIDRFRSMDVGGAAIIAGHVLASTARNMLSMTLVFAVAFLIGFRPDAGPGAWLATIGLLVAYILAMSWLSAMIGLLAKTPEAAGGFGFFMLFLPYLSSGFVPIETMPEVIHGFATYQPTTPIIDSARGLLLGQAVGDTPWLGLSWCAGILAVAVVLSGVLFARRAAR